MKTNIRNLKDYHILPDILAHKALLFDKIKHNKVGVFLDYDGTLTPIATHPERAFISEEMRQTIYTLSQLVPIAIVSGRNRNNIQDLVNLKNLYYVGNHGFDIEGPANSGIHYEVGHESVPAMEKCFRELQTSLLSIPGIQLEPKRLSVTFHYRLVDAENVQTFVDIMRSTVEKYPQLKLTSGKKVLEIRPNLDWDKGRGVLWLAEKLNLKPSDSFLIYIGDDLTDEDAFRILPAQGAGILVGFHEKQTYADFHLNDPGEVKIWLADLAVFLTKNRK